MNHKVIIAIVISVILIAMVFAGTNIPYPGHQVTTRLVTGKDHERGNYSRGGSNDSNAPHNFTISGNIFNLNNGLSLNGTIEVKNSTMSKIFNTSANGSYKISLPGGNYSVLYSSYGFYNKPVSVNLSSNITENVLLPSNHIIGNGITQFSNKTLLATNSPNISNIVPYLNDTGVSGGLNTNGITGILNQNITVSLGKNLNYTQFVVLIKVDGAIYKYTGTTNSSGMAKLFLDYSGNYTMAAYTLCYNSSFIKYNIIENNTDNNFIKFNMTELTVYQPTLILHSSEEFNGTSSVARTNITAYGGVFIVPISYVNSTSNGTHYKYKVPAGTYDFTYNNVHYVINNFNINITGNITTRETINPYLISINITNNIGKSYNYTIEKGTYGANGTYRAQYGPNEVNVYVNGSKIYSTSINLYHAEPYYQLNFTISNHNVTLSGIATLNSNLILTYSGNITSNFTITALDFKNFTTDGHNGTVTISGVGSYNGTLSSGNYFYNLTSPLNVGKGGITITLVYDPAYSIDGHHIHVEIYGYNVVLSGHYIKE